MTEVQVRTGTVGTWLSLGWWDKHVLVAYVGVTDTMQAWEDYMSLPKDER